MQEVSLAAWKKFDQLDDVEEFGMPGKLVTSHTAWVAKTIVCRASYTASQCMHAEVVLRFVYRLRCGVSYGCRFQIHHHGVS